MPTEAWMPFNQYLAQKAKTDFDNYKSQAFSDLGYFPDDPYAGMSDDQIAAKMLNGKTPQQYAASVDASGTSNNNLRAGADGQLYFRNQLANDDQFDFGNVLLAAGAAGVGALSGGFGLGSLFDAAGGTPAGLTSGAPTGLEAAEAGAGGTAGATTATGATNGTLMPPADPSGMNPNMIETGTPNWNPTAPVGTGAGSVASTAAQSILSKIANGTATSDDWLKLIGQVGPSVLGAFGANSQSNSLTALADKFAGFGAPYRDQLAALMKDPSSFYSSPEATGAFDAMARKLSIGGNPAQDPYKQATLTGGLYSLLQGKENQLGTLGGLANFNAAAPGAATNAVGSNANVYNAIGSGIGSVLNPPTDLASILASLKNGGINFGSGTYALA